MNFDRNTIIGFVLLMLLLFGFMFFSQRQQMEFAKQKQRVADSIAAVNKAKQRLRDSIAAANLSPAADSTIAAQTATGVPVASVPEQLTVVANNVMKVTFTNKGAYPLSVELNAYKRWDGSAVVLGGKQHKLVYDINTGNNLAASTEEIPFSAPQIVREGNAQ
ncbi:MAG: membrane protein insertase YidC, partial [Chitinophagaceae bacterium]